MQVATFFIVGREEEFIAEVLASQMGGFDNKSVYNGKALKATW